MKQKIVELIQSSEIESNGEVALARSLSSLLRSNFEGVVVCQGTLYLYSSGLWSAVDKDELMSVISAFDGMPYIVGDKPKTLELRHSHLVGIYRSFLVCREILDNNFFDAVPGGVSFLNGFVAVDGAKLSIEPHSPDQRATMQIQENIPANPGKVVPEKFIAFLQDLFKDDEDAIEKIALLREFVGCCLAGMASQLQRALILRGPGGNGKTVLIEAISALFDPKTVVSSSPSKWGQDYYVAMLRHARINVCSELPVQSNGGSSETIKQVISGDYVTGREIYGRPISFRPSCGHIFAANVLPSAVSGDYSAGFFRRWVILELKREFTKEQERKSPREIKKELESERGTIILWALRSISKVLERGEYTTPKSSAEVFDQWQVETNPIADFLESCTMDSETREMLAFVYESYCDFTRAGGRHPLSKPRFNAEMRQLKVDFKRVSTGYTVNLKVKPRVEWKDFTHSGNQFDIH